MSITKHYEKVIVACCFLSMFVNTGFASTSFNVYQPSLVAIVGDTGGSVVLAMRTLTSLVAIMFVDRYFHLLDCRRGISIACMLTAAAFMIYSAANSLPMFLLGAFVAGVAYGLGGMVGVTLLVRRWFRMDVGKAVGVAAVGSGVASIVIPIVAMRVIEGVSLAASFRMEAIIALALGAVIFALLRNRPSDLGMQPFGEQGGQDVKAARRDSGKTGNRLSRRNRLLVMAAMVMLGMLCVGGAGYMAVMLTTEGFSTMFAATLLSVFGIALTASKYIAGVLFDKMGTRQGSTIMFAVFVAGALMCCLAGLQIPALSTAGVLLYGAGASLGTVGVSVWSIEMADPKNYARSIKNFQLAYSGGGFLGTVFPGPLKELAGSYTISYEVLFVLSIACAAIVVGTYWRHRTEKTIA